MTTDPKGLIEEIIDNAMTPAKDLKVDQHEKLGTRALADRKSTVQTAPDNRLREARLSRK